ncbi:MAG: glutamine synthetase, partial [Pseudonocardiaceae bacterium]
MTPLTIERFLGGREAQAKDVLALAQEHEVRMVDFKFTDLPGTWQHLGLSIHSLDEDAFVEGL